MRKINLFKMVRDDIKIKGKIMQHIKNVWITFQKPKESKHAPYSIDLLQIS